MRACARNTESGLLAGSENNAADCSPRRQKRSGFSEGNGDDLLPVASKDWEQEATRARPHSINTAGGGGVAANDSGKLLTVNNQTPGA